MHLLRGGATGSPVIVSRPHSASGPLFAVPAILIFPFAVLSAPGLAARPPRAAEDGAAVDTPGRRRRRRRWCAGWGSWAWTFIGAALGSWFLLLHVVLTRTCEMRSVANSSVSPEKGQV